MAPWLIGIGIAGFFVSLLLSLSLRPAGLANGPGRDALARWWAGALGIGVVGVVLAVLFAWPAWLLGRFLGPYFDVSSATGGAVFACIFGLGGAAVTGAFGVAWGEHFEDAGRGRR